MNRRKRRLRLPKKKHFIFLLIFLVVFIGGVGGLFLWVQDYKGMVSPLPEGGFRIASKSVNQKEKEIEKILSENHLLVESVSRSSDSAIIVSFKDNGDAYLSEEKYLEELPSLQLIISQLTMEGKRFKRLDLRFERPILVL